jgi:hypothetical protein
MHTEEGNQTLYILREREREREMKPLCNKSSISNATPKVKHQI